MLTADYCSRIIDASPGATVVVIGTTYKDMELKPNILDEFSSEVRPVYTDFPQELLHIPCFYVQRQIAPPPARANYCSASDFLVLEDGSGRIPLKGLGALMSHLVSGVWLAKCVCASNFGAHHGVCAL
jgi:DNA polymerase delta subunit OB-fold domain